MSPTKVILVLAVLCASFAAECKVDIDRADSTAGHSGPLSKSLAAIVSPSGTFGVPSDIAPRLAPKSLAAPSASLVKPSLDVLQYLYVAASAGSRMTGLVFKQSTNAAVPGRAHSDMTTMPDSQSVALLLAILGAVAFIGRRRRRD